jgi:hypothetical protein
MIMLIHFLFWIRFKLSKILTIQEKDIYSKYF